MADNVLTGVVNAIAESDNELSGHLITRLREAHLHGRDDSVLLAAAPTQLTSLVDIFTAAMVDQGLDILEPLSGAATGNEGSFIVATYIDAKNITLKKVDNSAPSFVDQDPVIWRFTTLRVETTLDFPANDKVLQLWVGKEENAIPYAEKITTPGAQEFRGIGAHTIEVRGQISSAAPSTLSTVSDFFSSSMVGKTAWVLPEDPANGNEGPQLITAFVDAKNVTVSPGGFITSQSRASFRLKMYENSDGYLTEGHRENTEVLDGSQSFSDIDKLRRSFLVEYATEEELDRIGRNLAVIRPRYLEDEIFRELIKVISYLPKATIYGIELVLEALFPGEAWEIYEDLVNFPATVFILLPLMAGDSTEFEGKAFLSPAGTDVTPPVDLPYGQGQREKQTSSSSTTVDITHTPITIVDVLIEPIIQELEMGVLPSADSPAWTYDNQGAAEGTIFSVAASILTHSQPTVAGGGYYRTVAEASARPGSTVELSCWWNLDSLSVSGGHPYHLGIYDSAINKQYFLFWTAVGTGECFLGSDDETQKVSPVAPSVDLSDGKWHHFRIKRTSYDGFDTVQASVDGQDLFGIVNLSTFDATALNRCHFGYFNNALAQSWIVEWDRVQIDIKNSRNYWNLSREDGLFNGADDVLRSAAALFIAGDSTKNVRIWDEGSAGSSAQRNVGLWAVKTVNAAGELELEGIRSDNIVTVSTVGSDNFVELLDPLFVPKDVTKELELFDSILGNNGTRTVLEWISAKKARVDGSAFVSEQELAYQFNPNTFVASTGARWELIDVGSVAAKTLTLRETLPASSVILGIWYTAVLSAQIVRNEFVTNEGSAGSSPNVRYPFYVFDVDLATREIIDAITAAGVIAEYEREF
ncbi:MAG: hypothetical protein ACYTEW_17545 [Planctomycetota bacterium]|jgi:hypothetical protein